MGSPCPKPLKGMTVTDFLPFISKVKFTVLIHCLIILTNFSQKPNALGSQDEAPLHFFMSFDKIQFNSEMTLFLLGFFLKKMCISSWEITIFSVIQGGIFQLA